MAGPTAGATEIFRTKHAKHFRNLDNTNSAILYTGAVHYQGTPGGAWLDKSPSLHAGPGTAEWISDTSDVTMRTYQVGRGGNAVWWVEFKETLTGDGIAFQLDFQPTTTAGSDTLSFSSPDGTWTYTHTPSGGKMWGPPMPASVGSRTYQFPYSLLGNAPPLTLNPDGSISCGQIFRMEKPHLIGADNNQYAETMWAIPSPGILSWTYDDTALPSSAYPYRADPSTVFAITASDNDQYVRRTQTAWPPSSGTFTRLTTDTLAYGLDSSFATPNYTLRNTLWAWDTSSLSGNVVSAVSLTINAADWAFTTANAPTITGEYYAWDGTSTSDWSSTVAVANQLYPTAINELAASSYIAAPGGDKTLPMVNPSNISTTGTTKVRAYINAGTPTGDNYIGYRTYDFSTTLCARLNVDYTAAAPPTRMAPDAILSMTNLSGTVADIDEDPDTGDASWLTA